MMKKALREKIIPDIGAGTLGTFAGVFTPSVLTILGIILFLRLGYVTGSAGLGRALVMIGLANAISVLTSFSLSAIATNIRVKGGGDYYLISRTLGTEFGGAIGIVLFLAQSVSIAFYCIGFGEAVADMLPKGFTIQYQIVAVLAVSFLFIFAWLGADVATKFQYVVMGLLAAALFSFFLGGVAKWDTHMLASNWRPLPAGPGFWILFAIFFPAVTGFTQGVSMSGDLKDPGKSLPLGTFLAVGISIIVYFGSAVVLSASLPNEVLSADYEAMKKAARFGFLIDAGVVAATLSSAMASFLGAPRILQSMAADRIFPRLVFFAKGSGPAANPRRGVLVSAGIAYVTIALGNLNVIAPVVSMFFLISYGLLNYATYYEARTASPSFRPRFRWFNSKLSLLGAMACFGAMLAIDIMAGMVAIAVLFGIYQYLKRTAGPSRWADSRRSYHLQQVREHLLAAAVEPEHPRDWRPHLLAFSNDPQRREHLLRFSSWLEGRSGLTTAVKILEGEGIKMLKLREEAEEELSGFISEHELDAFPLVVVAPDLQTGVHTLVQSFGIGPLHANVVLLNWIEQSGQGFFGVKELRYARNLHTAFRLGCNIVVLDAKDEAWEDLDAPAPEKKRIDVWWFDDATSRLMLLLAYLMTRSAAWEGAGIRVLASRGKEGEETALDALDTMLQEVRIGAKPVIVPDVNGDAVVEHSAGSNLVFLPFRLRRNRLVTRFGEKPEDLLPRLPMTALALAAEDIDLDAEPEEGTAAEAAAALDALEDAQKKAREMEKEASRAAEAAEKKLNELNEGIESGGDEETIAGLKTASEKARDESEKAARRAGKARAKAEDAARAAEALGALPPCSGDDDEQEAEKENDAKSE